MVFVWIINGWKIHGENHTGAWCSRQSKKNAKVSLPLLNCRPESPVVNYLVAQALAGDNGDLIADLLVDLEVQGELAVVALNNDLGGPLDGLRANATHDGEVVVVGESAVVCSR